MGHWVKLKYQLDHDRLNEIDAPPQDQYAKSVDWFLPIRVWLPIWQHGVQIPKAQMAMDRYRDKGYEVEKRTYKFEVTEVRPFYIDVYDSY